MALSTNKAKQIISFILQGQSVNFVKSITTSTESEWYRFSNKAYSSMLSQAKRERKSAENSLNISGTSSEEISDLLTLNETLANYALAVNIFATASELATIIKLAKNLPESEILIIDAIEKITLNPRIRALQKKGRFEKFEHFKVFSTIIDAAVISYYRNNYISSYLTLLPVVEGIIIRWMGYTEQSIKPEFEDIRKFFGNPAIRQPCPTNIQFHDIFSKACDKILNNHFYKPTSSGIAYSNFNRHVASHLLNDNQFATKENCVRLFLLLDIMTEIFLYESRNSDPRFNLRSEEITKEIEQYILILKDSLGITPEKMILHTQDRKNN